MASATEAKAAIESGFAAYISELEQCAASWERKPEGAADGEAAWCAREVAEHIGGAGPFFGVGIANAIGAEPPALARISLPEHAAAVAETRRTHGLLMDVVAKVTDDNIGTEIDHPRFGKTSVGGMLGVVSYHLNDHAQQLKALRGG